MLVLVISALLISCKGGNKSSEPQVTGPADTTVVAPVEPVDSVVVDDSVKVVVDSVTQN